MEVFGEVFSAGVSRFGDVLHSARRFGMVEIPCISDVTLPSAGAYKYRYFVRSLDTTRDIVHRSG